MTPITLLTGWRARPEARSVPRWTAPARLFAVAGLQFGRLVVLGVFARLRVAITRPWMLRRTLRARSIGRRVSRDALL